MSAESGLLRVIGLMSGTSLDGVDAALIETDGVSRLRFGPSFFQPFGEDDRSLLRAALARASVTGRIEQDGPIAAAQRMVTDRHGQAVETFCADAQIDRSSLDLIGFHGQTILHRPREGLTLQIGDGQALAERLHAPVVYDFRRADVAAGGEGAPLAPVFHQALADWSGLPRPVALLNVGGVANVTLLPESGDPIACDTGPGNALLDDLMLARSGVAFDRNGETAARGRVDDDALARLLDHAYFALPPPKSLDRNQFSNSPIAGLGLEDAAATLVAFTAETVAALLRRFAPGTERLVVCGGGAHNQALMAALRDRTACLVQSADDLGWSADALEAQAFGYMAVRSLRGLPLTFPTTTGAPNALTGGVLAQPAA